jgi:phosphoglycolate phosphatase-like HAD superfamily hydrolase
MVERSSKRGAVRGVLLDVDGTLLDSNDAHAKAWVTVFAEFALPAVPFDEVRKRIGKGGDKLLAETVGIDDGSPEGKKINARRRELFLRLYLPPLRPFPRARELVERMRDDGLKRVVATSAQGDELRALLGAAGVADLIDEEATSSDAKSSKPDPDIVEAAIDRAGLPAADLIMIGDTPYDVEAARRAGVATIAVRSGGWGDRDLEGAVAVYDDVADLLERYDASPLRGG